MTHDKIKLAPAAVGNRVELYTYSGRGLTKVAFYDAPLLITSLNVVKDFILLGDVHKSVFFIRFQVRALRCTMFWKP